MPSVNSENYLEPSLRLKLSLELFHGDCKEGPDVICRPRNPEDLDFCTLTFKRTGMEGTAIVEIRPVVDVTDAEGHGLRTRLFLDCHSGEIFPDSAPRLSYDDFLLCATSSNWEKIEYK